MSRDAARSITSAASIASVASVASEATGASAPAGTIADLLERIAEILRAEGVSDSRREARDIVAAVLDVPAFWSAANAALEAPSDAVRSAMRAARKRASGAPLAYAVGRASFRHLTLKVDERVLIPRVETEILVELVLERSTSETRVIADIGTGSGAIGLSLAFERKLDRVIATDISLDALAVAKSNASVLRDVLKTPVEFRHGSLLAPLEGDRLDAIVSNPPYISFAEGLELPTSVRDWEPSLALLCPEEGLSVTRDLIRQAPAFLNRGGFLALEVDTRRAGSVAEVVAADGRYRNVEVLLDLTGRERFVIARRAESD